jgi:hypothetical protein
LGWKTPEEGSILEKRTRSFRLADEQPLESAVGIATCMRSRILYAQQCGASQCGREEWMRDKYWPREVAAQTTIISSSPFGCTRGDERAVLDRIHLYGP